MAIHRRQFLTGTALSAAAMLAVRVRDAAGATPASSRLTPEEFRCKLRGPILSFPTCFTADFQLDYVGMRRIVDRALEAGVGVVTLTAGNNYYDCLSYDEIKQLTRFMVEAVDRRAITIAAGGAWWTGQSADYAKFAESVGADAVQILMATRGDDDGHLKHFQQIAAATRLPLVLHGEPSLALWRRLVAIDSLVAFKLEADHPQGVPLLEEFGERLTIFAGGQDSMFLAYRPHGMRAYFSALATFVPEIGMQVWKAVNENRLVDAQKLIEQYETPFFAQWGKFGGHAFWRATLEHLGVASRWLRPPEQSLTDAQMLEVRQFCKTLGLKGKKVN